MPNLYLALSMDIIWHLYIYAYQNIDLLTVIEHCSVHRLFLF